MLREYWEKTPDVSPASPSKGEDPRIRKASLLTIAALLEHNDLALEFVQTVIANMVMDQPWASAETSACPNLIYRQGHRVGIIEEAATRSPLGGQWKETARPAASSRGAA